MAGLSGQLEPPNLSLESHFSVIIDRLSFGCALGYHYSVKLDEEDKRQSSYSTDITVARMKVMIVVERKTASSMYLGVCGSTHFMTWWGREGCNPNPC